MFRHVRFIGLIEENLRKVRKISYIRLLYWDVSRKSAEGRRYRNVRIYVYKGDLDITPLAGDVV